MAEVHQTDLELVLAAIAESTRAAERKSERIHVQIQSLRERRSAYLLGTAASLLPDINARVLQALRSEVPGFANQTVVDCFQTNHKILWVFKGKNFRSTLAMLRTRLANYLDRTQYGGLPRIDAEIERAMAELDAHNAQTAASGERNADLLALLGKVIADKVPLSARAEEQIKNIADVARERTASDFRLHQTRSLSSKQQLVGGDRASSGSDDFDLWLYLATDVPTSLRTLLLSAINSHHHGLPTDSRGQFSGAGASGSWDDAGPAQTDPTTTNVEAAAAATALGALAISTDDSLGRYS